MRNNFLYLVMVGAFLGFVFASFSTYDFVRHLDRQVHGVHCSFVPGLSSLDVSFASGCQVTMMSPYSSVLRTTLWGGLPVSLPGMAVFACLFFFCLDLWLGRRDQDPGATGFLALATLVPFGTSLVMGYIALVTLDAACKLCIGIYVASVLCLIGAIGAWRTATQARLFEHGSDEDDDGMLSVRSGYGGMAFFVGVAFVAVPAAAYVAMAPNHDAIIPTCGTLDHPRDRYGVMVPVGESGPGSAAAIEVLDPLCPACAALEERLGASGLLDGLARKVVLFPLDNSCNWMVDSAIHAGACTVSKAVLCAGNQVPEVLHWAFANQEEVRAASEEDPRAARRMVLERFPSMRRCLGSASVTSKLNKSLRWAVRNRLQLLTPQLYVEGVRLCDEDLDLGLDYALKHILTMRDAGTLPKPVARPARKRFVEPAPTEEPQPAGGDPGPPPQQGGETAAPTPTARGEGDGKLEPAPEPKAPEPKAPEPKAPEPKAPESKAPEPKAPEPKDRDPSPTIDAPLEEADRAPEPQPDPAGDADPGATP